MKKLRDLDGKKKKSGAKAPKEQEVAPFAGHKDDVASEGVGIKQTPVIEQPKEDKGPENPGSPSAPKEDSLNFNFVDIADAATPAATPPVADAAQVSNQQSSSPLETTAQGDQSQVAPPAATQSDNPLVLEFELYMKQFVGKNDSRTDLEESIGAMPFAGDPNHPLEKFINTCLGTKDSEGNITEGTSPNPKLFEQFVPYLRVLAALFVAYSKRNPDTSDQFIVPQKKTATELDYRAALNYLTKAYLLKKDVKDLSNPDEFTKMLFTFESAFGAVSPGLEQRLFRKDLGKGDPKQEAQLRNGFRTPLVQAASPEPPTTILSTDQVENLLLRDALEADAQAPIKPPTEPVTVFASLDQLVGNELKLAQALGVQNPDSASPVEISKEPSTVVTTPDATAQTSVPLPTDLKDDKTPIPPNAPGLVSPAQVDAQQPTQEPVAASSTSMSANDKVGVETGLLADGQKVGAGQQTLARMDPFIGLYQTIQKIERGEIKPHIGINSNVVALAVSVLQTSPFTKTLPADASKEQKDALEAEKNVVLKQYAALLEAAEQIDTKVDNSLSSVTVVRNARQVIPIGDVQGDFDSLTTQFVNAGVLVADATRPSGFALNPEMPPGTQIVFIGDLMDRKDKGMEVIDLVRDLTAQATPLKCTVHLVMGNHEQLILDFITRYQGLSQSEVLAILAEPQPPAEPLHEDDPNRGFWTRAGVDQTFNSIVRKYGSWENAATKMVEDGTIDFIKNAKGMVVIDNMAFFHGGPIKGDKLEDLGAIYTRIFTNPTSACWNSIYLNSGKYANLKYQVNQSGDLSGEYAHHWAGSFNTQEWLGGMTYQGNPLNLTHAYVGHHRSEFSIISNYGPHVTGLDAGMCYGGNNLLIIDPLHSYAERIIAMGNNNQLVTSLVPTLESKGYDTDKRDYVWAYPTTQSTPRSRCDVINNPLAVQADEVLSPKAPVPAAPVPTTVAPVVAAPTVSPAQELATEFAGYVKAGDYDRLHRTVLGIAVMATGDVLKPIRNILANTSAPENADALLMEAVTTLVTGKADEFVKYAVTPSATGQSSVADGKTLTELYDATLAVLNAAPDQVEAEKVRSGIANVLYSNTYIRAAALVVRAVSASETDPEAKKQVYEVFRAICLNKILFPNVYLPALISYASERYTDPALAKAMLGVLLSGNDVLMHDLNTIGDPVPKLKFEAQCALDQKTLLVVPSAAQQAQKTATALETLKSDLDKAGRKYSKRQVVDAFTVSTRLARKLEKGSNNATSEKKYIEPAVTAIKGNKEVLEVAVALVRLSNVDGSGKYSPHLVIPIDYLEGAASLKQPFFPTVADLQGTPEGMDNIAKLAQRIVDRRKSAKGAVWLKRGGAAVAVGSIAALLAMSSQHRTKVVPAPPAPIVEEVEPAPAPATAPKAPKMTDCTDEVQVAVNDAFKAIPRGSYQQAYNNTLGRRDKAKSIKDSDGFTAVFTYSGILSNGSPTTYNVTVNRKDVNIEAPKVSAEDCKLTATVGDKTFRTTIAPACDENLTHDVNIGVFGSTSRVGAASRENIIKKGTAAIQCAKKGSQPYVFTVTSKGKVILTSANPDCIREKTVGKEIPTVIVSAPKSNCSVRLEFTVKTDPYKD